MIDLGDLMQRSYAADIPAVSAAFNAALSPAGEGLKAYANDMDKMRAILSSPPAPFPWDALEPVALILLILLAALTAVWIQLNRRSRRLATPEIIDAAFASVVSYEVRRQNHFVVPAQAGTQFSLPAGRRVELDSRLRGNAEAETPSPGNLPQVRVG
jgi:hypothetical protein